MGISIKDNIKQSLQAADSLYYRLVLLVGETGSGKTGLLREFANDLGTSVINVNLTLSMELLELTPKKRALRLPDIFNHVLETSSSPVLLDNIEILFDKDLEQDPLRLLLSISRNRSVVASWNGKSTGKKLIYAEINHPEYRSYDSVDALIVNMNGTATINSDINNIEAGQL
jgi:hypothetical protein